MNKNNDLEILKQQQLDDLYDKYKDINTSPLSIAGCINIVFGEGNPNARLILIGEAPGKEEDLQGRPFVGSSGKLLDKILDLAGITRKNIYITNVLKCRPKNNRVPNMHEIILHKKLILEKQLGIIQPRVICTLGSTALHALIGQSKNITIQRGHPIRYNNIVIIPTLHPAYVYRNNTTEKDFLEDILLAFELSKKD